ncbi:MULTISPECIES: hypothetical protein [Streptomyces]|uniref:hypothetical protein n=1 Tax=Streptomyces TaxID=1883 RepID=UPI001BEF8B5E|nr:hypothetical protein [Streptomyces sp. EAS-AB2608]BCM66787.1 hypothetical protein EASAB2608_02121 [Streptomyces sp. EAS-AB2608]
MSGHHRAPSADGRTAGAALLGSIAAGLALVGAAVSTAVRADAAPVGAEGSAPARVGAIDVTPDRPAPHTDRTRPRTEWVRRTSLP